MHSNLVAWSRSLRFLQLTFVILLFLLIMPLLSGHPYISFSFHLVLLNALLVSLSASDRLPGLRWVLAACWLIGMGLYSKATLFPEWGSFRLEVFLGAVFYLMFLLGCIGAMLIYVFKSPRITLDTIFAAVVAYFFLSIIFAIIFTMLFSFNPHYFNLPVPVTLPQFHLLTNDLFQPDHHRGGGLWRHSASAALFPHAGGGGGGGGPFLHGGAHRLAGGHVHFPGAASRPGAVGPGKSGFSGRLRELAPVGTER
jgi:hypothetical protein